MSLHNLTVFCNTFVIAKKCRFQKQVKMSKFLEICFYSYLQQIGTEEKKSFFLSVLNFPAGGG